jgi:hypothetical protein
MSEYAAERAKAAQMKQPLEVEIRGGELSITIGLGTLCYAVQQCPSWGSRLADFKVTDEEAFAQAVLHQLTREDEIGTTAVHKMLDAAAEEAIEQGAEGVEEVPPGGPHGEGVKK